MAMKRWLGVALVAAAAWAAGGGKVLLQADFEAAQPGAPPSGWPAFVDTGNAIEVVAQPALGKRSVRLHREGGTVWKPMLSGNVMGEPNSSLSFEFDVRVGQLADRWDEALVALLRGEVNVALVEVAVGGPGGVAVLDEQGDWLALDFPLQPDSWAHMAVVTDPLTEGSEAAFDLTVTQGEERLRVPNIPFRRLGGAYPAAWWHSPTFHIGGGSSQRPTQAWIDNVCIMRVDGRVGP